MSAIKAKTRQRTNLKSQLTRFCNFFDGIKTETIDDLIYNQLNTRLILIEPVLSTFLAIQDELDDDQINNLSNDTAETEEIEILNKSELHRAEFEDKYFNIIGQVKAYMATFDSKTRSHSVVPAQPVGATVSRGIKLPNLNMPTFTGQYSEWRQFHDTFNALIDSDASLTNIQKFYYLKSALKNEAAAVIDSLEVSDLNYPIAWRLLKERFENKKIITNNHIKIIFDIPTITKESHIALRNLYDCIIKNIRCLGALGLPVDTWDTLLIFIIVSKFDNATRRAWEQYEIPGELATFDELSCFLKKRCEVLEAVSTPPSKNENHIAVGSRLKKPLNVSGTYFSSNQFACQFCNGSHNIYNCANFSKLSINDRINEAKKLHFCLNCLRKNHVLKDCFSKSSCRRCNKKHHTLLHMEYQSNPKQTNPPNSSSKPKEHAPTENVALLVSSGERQLNNVLLATAIVQVPNSDGVLQPCRVLLDSASQSNFITEETVEKLHLQKLDTNSRILGINKNGSNIRFKTNLKILSNHNAFEIDISCLVLKNITEPLPSFSIDNSVLNIPATIRLADPSYNVRGKIDILLGATIFWNILCAGQLQLGPDKPILQKTKFGWVLSGDCLVNPNKNKQTSLSYLCTEKSCERLTLESQVAKFWELEEVKASPKFSEHELEIETHYLENTTRSQDGKFVVKIPFNENISKLGESRSLTLKRFQGLERKLAKNPELSQEYNSFLLEYEQLGHMTKIKENPSELNTYYLPHHCVIKQSSSTTKVRVVFDASLKTNTGLSLNDVQSVGPIIQDDLFSLLVRFRKYPFVLTADIEKMYRQVLLHNDERKYHRIFWRNNPSEELSCFELNTVTYGTASASFLSTRCLRQLANEHQSQYPDASSVVANDFYMDDLLTGAFNKESLEVLKKEVTLILKNGGFNLRKFLSNDPSLSESSSHSSIYDLQLSKDFTQTKTLGVCWNNILDLFKYSILDLKDEIQVTKRNILSVTAQVFDPLGLLSAIIINAKIILQELWQIKLTWDESVPLNLHTRWLHFRDQLLELNSLEIKRCVLIKEPNLIELHGFADSSQRAYGACVYVRSLNADGDISVNLLCAKSRVVPLKSVSIPRLELCAAVLLSNIVKKVCDCIQINFSKLSYYTDSTITLCWIQGVPQRWKTFVANRVAEIQSLSNISDWHHVSSADNPADLISRGTTPKTLINSHLWWHGPSWLSKHDLHSNIDKANLHEVDVPEEKRQEVSLVTQTQPFDIFALFSTFAKLQRVTAWCLRYISNLKTPKNKRVFGCLSVKELNKATTVLISLAQREQFGKEIYLLGQGLQVDSKSKILSLRPILVNDIIRVGGRIEMSGFAKDKIHPIILPKGHTLTKLITRQEHVNLLHCGPQLLLSSLRQKYWPISARNLVRQIVHSCTTCRKVKPQSCSYIMGSLPKTRFSASFPFENVGVDYAGPFVTRDRKSKPYKEIKSYAALFVCLLTKAIHIELVSELTTSSFLLALRRFIARRGKPNIICSDNGTNFVGACNKLNDILDFLKKRENQNNITDFLSNQEIDWRFIPSSSPHFGGLWEAGVKSMKGHMKKVIGSVTLSFEELATTLIQIESVLNSRPLYPLSPDPTDLNPITPSHFLIGRSAISIPDEDVRSYPENRLKTYEKLQRLHQMFWDRWSKDYISNLQERTKWKSNGSTNPQLGMLVLIKEDNLPPLCWKMGRIVDCHPGSDGVVRVVTVQCATNKLKRPVVKICPLPIETDNF